MNTHITTVNTIVGARPYFIKAEVVSHAFAQHDVSEMLIHTGQNFDTNMPDVFFDELEIPLPPITCALLTAVTAKTPAG